MENSHQKQSRKPIQKRIGERLERYIAHKGLASRREAKSLINRGLVLVNNKVTREPGLGIDPEFDIITLKTNSVPPRETVLIYKPRGIETTATSADTEDIHSRFPQFKHLSPIGRLDRDTDGLILLSNDGTLTRIITGPQSMVEKEYQVTVREVITPEIIRRMETGIVLDRKKTLPTTAIRIDKNTFTIVLREGRKHQIRRMCDACRLTVTSLKRIRIGHLTIGKMVPGWFKVITQSDVDRLKSGQ